MVSKPIRIKKIKEETIANREWNFHLDSQSYNRQGSCRPIIDHWGLANEYLIFAFYRASMRHIYVSIRKPCRDQRFNLLICNHSILRQQILWQSPITLASGSAICRYRQIRSESRIWMTERKRVWILHCKISNMKNFKWNSCTGLTALCTSQKWIFELSTKQRFKAAAMLPIYHGGPLLSSAVRKYWQLLISTGLARFICRYANPDTNMSNKI